MNLKNVIVVLPESTGIPEIYSTASAAFKALGWNYHTAKKRWVGGVIDFNGVKLYRKEIKR